MLYSILSSAVQSRLPKMPSLRRTVSAYGLSENPRAAKTPIDEDRSVILLRNRASEMDLYSSSREADEALNLRQKPLEFAEQDSGIGWKYAGQGGLSNDSMCSRSLAQG
jgi:hypothetical protein